jgi:hypothetical protein
LEREKEAKQANHLMAQGGGKPTFIVPKWLRREQATTTINKMLTKPTS